MKTSPIAKRIIPMSVSSAVIFDDRVDGDKTVAMAAKQRQRRQGVNRGYSIGGAMSITEASGRFGKQLRFRSVRVSSG